MGLIKALSGAIRSSMASKFKEYFVCENMPANALIVKGQKRVPYGEPDRPVALGDVAITKSSVIAVGEGQAMLVVEDGRIVDFACEPGAYAFESSGQASMFAGNFGEGLRETFAQIARRFTFGGTVSLTQNVYYVNLKEMLNNPFQSAQPVPYDDPHYGTVLYVDYSGVFSFKVADPLMFYTSVGTSALEGCTLEDLLGQMVAELYAATDSAMNSLAGQGVKFSQLPSKNGELSAHMVSELSKDWLSRRGLELTRVALSKITPDARSRKRIEDFDSATILGASPAAIQGRMADAQAQAFENMGNSPSGTSGMDEFKPQLLLNGDAGEIALCGDEYGHGDAGFALVVRPSCFWVDLNEGYQCDPVREFEQTGWRLDI